MRTQARAKPKRERWQFDFTDLVDLMSQLSMCPTDRLRTLVEEPTTAHRITTAEMHMLRDLIARREAAQEPKKKPKTTRPYEDYGRDDVEDDE